MKVSVKTSVSAKKTSQANAGEPVRPSFFLRIKMYLFKPRGKSKGSERKTISVFFRLSLQDQMLFAKRLAIMLKAGVPIMQAINMMQKQTSSRSAGLVLKDLAAGVEGGQFLHSRLEKYRKHFGDFAINVIRVGEISGTLHENLAYLADEIQKKRELRRKVISALVYPSFIVVATLGIAILLISYIFPKILPVLQTFKGQLPFTTRTLIYLSSLFAAKGWLIALVFFGLIGIWIVLMRKSHKFKFWMHSLMLKVPVLGKLFINYHIANFCRTLGILLKSDVKIIEAAMITARTSTNLAYQKALYNLADNASHGGKISEFLTANSRIFPPMVGQMITVGESTGKLSDSLLYLADIYEQEVDELTKNFSTSIEPLLMIFMGLLVGFIAMSIITPIYSLTQSLSNTIK